MLEQVPSRRNPEVQNQAAALLFETAGSDAGMVSLNDLLAKPVHQPPGKIIHAVLLQPSCLYRGPLICCQA